MDVGCLHLQGEQVLLTDIYIDNAGSFREIEGPRVPIRVWN